MCRTNHPSASHSELSFLSTLPCVYFPDVPLLHCQEMIQFYEQNSLKECFKDLDTTLQTPHKQAEPTSAQRNPPLPGTSLHYHRCTHIILSLPQAAAGSGQPVMCVVVVVVWQVLAGSRQALSEPGTTSQPGTGQSCRCVRETASKSSPRRVVVDGGKGRCTDGWDAFHIHTQDTVYYNWVTRQTHLSIATYTAYRNMLRSRLS